MLPSPGSGSPIFDATPTDDTPCLPLVVVAFVASASSCAKVLTAPDCPKSSGEFVALILDDFSFAGTSDVRCVNGSESCGWTVSTRGVVDGRGNEAWPSDLRRHERASWPVGSLDVAGLGKKPEVGSGFGGVVMWSRNSVSVMFGARK